MWVRPGSDSALREIVTIHEEQYAYPVREYGSAGYHETSSMNAGRVDLEADAKFAEIPVYDRRWPRRHTESIQWPGPSSSTTMTRVQSSGQRPHVTRWRATVAN